ncbi:MAG: S8 family serine peptidase [Lachnospiraceae bacterium]|nr:S8 family serine peptidase [Lachnospiraceae bacterium]
MNKRITAFLLSGVMIFQTDIYAGAAEVQTPEENYVVMAEEIDAIQEVLGTEVVNEEIPEESHETLMQDAGIVVADLNSWEIRQLEKADIIVEEDIFFDAAASCDIQQTGEAAEEETEQGTRPEPESKTGAETGAEPENETESESETEPGVVTEPGNETASEDVTRQENNMEPEEETESETELEDKTETEEEDDSDSRSIAEPAAEWNLSAVHAQDYVKDGAADRVKIAVLDSGVAYRPDIPVEEHVTENGEAGFVMLEDGTGHGTAVASLIVGKPEGEGIQGMNEDAQIYSVQVLDSKNRGKLSSIVKGIYWSIEHDMDIINMSFGTGHDSEILHRAVRDAKDAGILLVAAAGNEPGEAVQYPAAYDEVIAVGASSMKGEIAESSARGEKVDIYAPGEEILVDAPLFGMDVADGTSMACAQVTAAASLILERDRSKDIGFVRGLLEDTANKTIDPESKKGLLDVEEALKQYDTYTAGGQKVTDSAEQKPVEVFEEEEIKALWGGKDHQKTIPEGVGGYKLMYAASVVPDQRELAQCDPNGYCVARDNPLFKNRRFHGSKNYKYTMEFLINLAHAYYNNKSVQDVYNSIEPRLHKVEDHFEYSTVQAIEMFLGRSYFSYLGVDEMTKKNKAYKIMGVAVHVAGDIYAHRTIVTKDMISQFKEADFKNMEEFKRKVATGTVEFRAVKNDLKKTCTKDYEDDIHFISSRYENAKKSVRQLLTPGEKYDFRTKRWSNGALPHKETLKQY